MDLSVCVFYFLAFVAVFSALGATLSAGAVKAVLFLILAYISVAGVFILIGQDFAAMLLTVVYVGAVAVLFLFVVMTLDSEGGRSSAKISAEAPAIFAVSFIFVLEMIAVLYTREVGAESSAAVFYDGSSIRDVGVALYTKYIFYFQASGVILLLAMVGAIALTLRKRPGVRRQNPAMQSFRTPAESVELVSVKPGSPLEDI